jgi:hypothetical protein
VIGATPAPPKQAAPVPPGPMAPVKEPAPVVREVPREASRESAKEVHKPQDVSFNGPSFLGLSGGSSESSAEYLLQDEVPSSGRGKMVITLLLLLVAAGLLGWKWHYGNFPWQSASNAPAATTAQPNASAPAATTTDAAPAQNPTDSTNAPNQAAPQNATPAPSQPAENSTATATDSSAANDGNNAAGKTAQPSASDAGQSSSGQATEQTPDNQAAANTPVKQAAATPKAAPRRTIAPEDDSPESEAQALLTQGERYLNGDGVPQNCGRAQDSLRSAADRGNFQAVSDLATMYSTGHCVKKDLPTSYRWFVKALHQQPNNSRISTDLQVLWNQMTPEEKQVAMQK